MRLLDAHRPRSVEVFNGERIIGIAGRSESRVSERSRRMSASVDHSQPPPSRSGGRGAGVRRSFDQELETGRPAGLGAFGRRR